MTAYERQKRRDWAYSAGHADGEDGKPFSPLAYYAQPDTVRAYALGYLDRQPDSEIAKAFLAQYEKKEGEI